MASILSIENELRWSWSNSIHQLISCLPTYDFVRIRRGLFSCENPSCGAVCIHSVDRDLEEHFDLLLTQNHDGARYLTRRDKTVLRIGGLHMKPNLDPNRYAEDFRNVGAIIATNDQLASFALRVNPNTTVIPNGVDLDHFKPGPSHPDRPERPFTIGFAGNIDGMGGPYKGWKHFIQAQVDLSIDGVLSKYVLYRHNQIAHDDMPEQFYHQIDALILPSQGEGCSNVVTEALACGVPVIMTKTGFHGERLTDYENVVYITRDLETESPETTVQICNAVRRLMHEPELYRRLAQNSRAFAVAHHDVRDIAAQYDAVFQGLLAPERTATYELASTEQEN
ncbi:MAG TPA: glycosyltransferase family 4 protein [Sedimentisphaerales bacterium]|nr:glycosyltransferase family 4 protein [Sedimentisphaerales bacterium]